jgi:hypothetical protein
MAMTVTDLLTAWEEGLTQTPPRRALTLLMTAHPELPQDRLTKLEIGYRNGLLIDLRETLFGPQLTGLASCPVCSERLELTLDVSDIKIGQSAEPKTELSLSLPNYQIQYRLPNSEDLMLIERTNDLKQAENVLYERCVMSVEHRGKRLNITELPSDVLSQIETAMSEADPQAHVQLNLSCPVCRHNWLATFDIASFLWSEITAWAKRILKEVHTLASAYGWGERDILALSPMRRQYYLTLLAESRRA